jgi:hypothetical protein
MFSAILFVINIAVLVGLKLAPKGVKKPGDNEDNHSGPDYPCN